MRISLLIIVVDYIMRTALGNLEEPVGFTIRPRQSIRHPAEKLADVEFADDVALITDTIKLQRSTGIPTQS